MSLACTEGIVLRSTNLQETDQILSVFTSDFGLIKLIVKGSGPRSSRSSPLTQGEFVFSETRNSDLFRCREITVLNFHLALRDNLACLEAACNLTQAIETSQFPANPAPKLYQLLAYYLSKLPTIPCPEVLTASFQLKLLKHDGVLATSETCAICNTTPSIYHFCEGELFCEQHAPYQGASFSHEEVTLLDRLTNSRIYSDLAAVVLEKSLADKVKQLFEGSMK